MTQNRLPEGQEIAPQCATGCIVSSKLLADDPSGFKLSEQ